MTKITLMLDIVDNDGDGLAGLIADGAQRQVAITVVDPHGPGAGNPTVQVTATRADLALWLLEAYTAWDGQGVRDLLRQATPAK